MCGENAKKALPQKSFRYVEFGFAAGCEAVALPRRHRPRSLSGYAPGLGVALTVIGPKATKGIAQRCMATLRRGLATASDPAAKPSLTSPMTFGARLAKKRNAKTALPQKSEAADHPPTSPAYGLIVASPNILTV